MSSLHSKTTTHQQQLEMTLVLILSESRTKPLASVSALKPAHFLNSRQRRIFVH